MDCPDSTMSEITDRLTGLKQLSFFLPGFSILYPIIAFPTFISLLNSPLIASVVVLLGLAIYATPTDSLFRIVEGNTPSLLRRKIPTISPAKYESDVRQSLDDLSAPDAPSPSRPLIYLDDTYSIFYTAYLPRLIRQKIEWLLSLYYFYSRMSLAAIVHFWVFLATTMYLGFHLLRPDLFSWFPPVIPDEAPESLFLKSAVLLGASTILPFLAYYAAGRPVHMALRLEKAAMKLYKDVIFGISRGTPPAFSRENSDRDLAPQTEKHPSPTVRAHQVSHHQQLRRAHTNEFILEAPRRYHIRPLTLACWSTSVSR